MFSVDTDWLEDTQSRIAAKMKTVRERSADKIPYSTENGSHDDMTDRKISWWTNGFWGGIQWLLYDATGEERYQEIALIQEKKLDAAIDMYFGLHHDVGFMWMPTSVAHYRRKQDKASFKRGMLAANFLAGRFNPAGEFIRAWNVGRDGDVAGWSIIDTMMNLPLLYWATEEIGDPRYRHIAERHAHTVMEHFVRPDGSVRHIVEFDPENGTYVREIGGQGYAEGSSWSRGQAWALYGFILCYIHTGKEEYLETAKRIANYFIANITEDYTPRLDFRQPDEPHLIDTTSSGIAACGLIELANHVTEWDRDLYLRPAVKMLEAVTDKYADWSDDTDNIVTHSSARYFEDKHHYAIIYADFFFIEAISKLAGTSELMW